MTDITDLHIRYLENLLAAQQAVGQQLYDHGYAKGRRHSRMEIPAEFTDALRYGGAQEHVHVPLGEGHVTIVLAHNGSGLADEQHEAEAWQELEEVRMDIREEVLEGVRYVQRRPLPASIAAAIWRRHERTAVVTNTKTRVPRLRAALRSPRPGWVFVLVIGCGVARRVGRGVTHLLTPTTTVAAASAAAVTMIATSPMPNAPPAEQERGHVTQGQARSAPVGPPLAFVRPSRPEAPKVKKVRVAAQLEAPPVRLPVAVPARPVVGTPVPVPVPITPTPAPPLPVDPPLPPSSGDDGGDSSASDSSGSDPATPDPAAPDPTPDAPPVTDSPTAEPARSSEGCLLAVLGDRCTSTR